MLEGAALAVAVALFLGFGWLVLVSRSEEEPVAARRALGLAAGAPLPYLAAIAAPPPFHTPLLVLLLALTLLVVLGLALPIRGRVRNDADTPQTRIDERDIMFSRALLQPGSTRFQEYYRENPEKRQPDDAFRAQPGLLKPGSSLFDPVTFSAARASFTTVEELRSIVDAEVDPDRVDCEPVSMTRFIKGWALKLGAHSVAIAELRDYHKYTTVGRGEHYGETVRLDHRFAIALTVEMAKEMIDRAPKGPTVMESAQQYLASGAIAVQIAQFIGNLGHPARAHIDGNYRVVCPLVARDAGLGEIGRMGLLMTPRLGPRVRIAVVTTDLPLIPDERIRDPSVIDFCALCSKCADACPSEAISFEDRTEIDGVPRWKIDSEACYSSWCRMGTDCARCVSVCPHSHPDNLLHNLVRLAVRNSSLARRAAIVADDLLYGRKPPPLELGDWMRVEESKTNRPYGA
jgi:reductive dehalogenase